MLLLHVLLSFGDIFHGAIVKHPLHQIVIGVTRWPMFNIMMFKFLIRRRHCKISEDYFGI